MRVQGVALTTLCGLLVAAAALAGSEPVAVSPGDPTQVARIANRCPTFSWAEVDGAQGYELVVYRLGREAGEERPVVRRTFPGSVYGWTPALDQCLKRGGRYAWSVAAMGLVPPSGWSEPALFEVDGASPGPARAALAEVEPHRRSPDAPTVSRDRRSATPAAPTPKLSHATVRDLPAFPPAGAPTASAPVLGTPALSVDAAISLGEHSHLFRDGDLFLWEETGDGNLALGSRALDGVSTGVGNTAVGLEALTENVEGWFNTALGSLASKSTTGDLNTAVGTAALQKGESVFRNTAVGAEALHRAEGNDNTAVGSHALTRLEAGVKNVAVGSRALASLGLIEASSSNNTAVGAKSLQLLRGGLSNVAVGSGAMGSLGVGTSNTVVGVNAGLNAQHAHGNTALGAQALSGYSFESDNNIAIGGAAGRSITTGGDNIMIGNDGTPTDSGTIRIGDEAKQSRTFIAGIRGVTTDTSDAVEVLVDSSGQLGTVSSSLRYKEQVREMAEVSERLYALRPVAFRYRSQADRDSGSVQFGLIAEEVARVFPELVVYDDQGLPETVKYRFLSSLLLNELQKQRRRIRVHEGLLLGLLLVVGFTAGRRIARPT